MSAATCSAGAALRHRRLWLLGIAAACLLCVRSLWPTPPHRRPVVISVASTRERLSHELPIALQTLRSQLTRLDEVHVYLPLADEAAVRRRQSGHGLPPILDDPLIRLHFVPDRGPATKFAYILEDYVTRARHGEPHLLDQPLIIVDDDHAYSPHLVSCLLAAHELLPHAAVGLRGWRVRPDLVWGVQPEFVQHHIQHGADLASPYQVSCLTANHGYLLLPRYLFDREAPSAAERLLFNRTALADVPAHLVDDIVMAGMLADAGIERFIVPLTPFFASPTADVSTTHVLDVHMRSDGFTRQKANNFALDMFRDAWQADDLYYDYEAPAPPRCNVFVRLWRRTAVHFIQFKWRASRWRDLPVHGV